MKRDEFERLFEQAFELALQEHIDPPDPTPSWHKVARSLKQRHNKKGWSMNSRRLMGRVASSSIRSKHVALHGGNHSEQQKDRQ